MQITGKSEQRVCGTLLVYYPSDYRYITRRYVVSFRVFKPIVWLFLFIMIVGLACGGPPAEEEPTSAPAIEPVEQPTEKPTEPPAEPEEIVETEEPEQPAGTGGVSNIQDVQGAVIQIEAQGTFVDPEYGEYSGGGSGSRRGRVLHTPAGL